MSSWSNRPTATAITSPTTPARSWRTSIKDTAARHGKLVIPAFAIGRVEEVLYWVRRLEAEHRIPVLPVYVDSPMATEALRYYSARVAELDPELRPTSGQVYAFATTRFQTVSSPQQSKELTASRRPAVVISSSGMATGGRVLHHLRRRCPIRGTRCSSSAIRQRARAGDSSSTAHARSRIHGRSIAVNAQRSPRSTRCRLTPIAARSSDGSERWRRLPDACVSCTASPGRWTRSKALIHERLSWDAVIHPRMERRLSSERRYLLERVDDAAVVQLYADGFASLPLREKILTWHLYLAALAGRDIYYDQRHAHSLEMRAVLEAILTHATRRRPEGSRRDSPVHEAVLDQQRPVQQRDRAKVRSPPDAAGVARSGGRCRAGGRRATEEPGESLETADRPAGADVPAIPRSIRPSPTRRPVPAATSWPRARTTSTRASAVAHLETSPSGTG